MRKLLLAISLCLLASTVVHVVDELCGNYNCRVCYP